MQNKALKERPEGITIAIPNWNHEYLLGRSVGSALRAVAQLQLHNVPAEVLVVDDFSRDGSITLLRQLEALYYHQGLRVYLKSHNSGLVDTRNIALHRARYRYALLLDADNEVLPENLYIFYKSIRETKAALVYGNLIVLREEKYADRLYNDQSVQYRLFDQNYIDAFALIDTHQILDTSAHISDHDLLEDWFRNLHLAANGRLVVFVPVQIGYYHLLPKSMVAGSPPEIDTHRRRRFERIFDQLGIRKDNHMRTLHMRYHPDLGFI